LNLLFYSDKIYNKPIPNDSCYDLGISPLHAKIRTFEGLLHIAYNKSFEKWKASKENVKARSDEKLRIQAEFKTRYG
jgi:hypothetical protein